MRENFYETKKKIMLAKTDSEKIELIKSYASNRFNVNLYEPPTTSYNMDNKVQFWTAKDYATLEGELGGLLKWAGKSSERDQLLEQWHNWNIRVQSPSALYEKEAFQFLDELQQMSDDEKIAKIEKDFNEIFKDVLDSLNEKVHRAYLSHDRVYEKELNDMIKDVEMEKGWFKEQAIAAIKDPEKRLTMANGEFYSKEMKNKALETATEYLEQTKKLSAEAKQDEQSLESQDLHDLEQKPITDNFEFSPETRELIDQASEVKKDSIDSSALESEPIQAELEQDHINGQEFSGVDLSTLSNEQLIALQTAISQEMINRMQSMEMHQQDSMQR